MEATGHSAQTSINNTITPTRQAQTQDYQTYWTYRNSSRTIMSAASPRGRPITSVVDGAR